MTVLFVILLFFLIPKTMVLGVRIVFFLGLIAIIGVLSIILIILFFSEYYLAFSLLLFLIGLIVFYERKK